MYYLDRKRKVSSGVFFRLQQPKNKSSYTRFGYEKKFDLWFRTGLDEFSCITVYIIRPLQTQCKKAEWWCTHYCLFSECFFVHLWFLSPKENTLTIFFLFWAKALRCTKKHSANGQCTTLQAKSQPSCSEFGNILQYRS